MIAAPNIEGGPWIMGIVNATPDSFSDGGRFGDAQAAIDAALKMAEDGADVIDVGGESTRPGAAPVSVADEIARVVPVIAGIRRASSIAISIDTMKPAVAREALDAGAGIWNDVNALREETALELAVDAKCDIVLMHMQGEPRTMQADPKYDDVVRDVMGFLRARAHAAMMSGVPAEQIWVDPGIGFGKTLAHNLALTAAIGAFKSETGFKVLYGASRKSFIGRIDGGANAGERLGGSLAAAIRAASLGADMLRVHDVHETVQAMRVWRAIERGEA